MTQRQALAYPPFGHLVNLVLSGNDLARLKGAAEQLADELGRAEGAVEVLGPAPCLLARLRNRHRMQILLKAEQRDPLRRDIALLGRLKKVLSPGVQLTVDIDPVDMF